MTDKVQKIREEVVRMHNLLPVMDGDNISVNYADRICTTLEMYIDSLQEEPVSEDLEKMSYHSAMDLINNPKFLPTTTFGELIPMLQKLYKDGAKWQREQIEEALLSEVLTWEDIKTIDKLLNQCVDCNNPYQEVLKRFKDYKERKEK